MPRRLRWVMVGILVGSGAVLAPVQAQSALPIGGLFRPLLADPKQPRFSAGYLWVSSTIRQTQVGTAAFGETFGLLRWPAGVVQDGLQLDLAAGVFAQFDLLTESMDLMNADYLIGVPLTYRRGWFSARLRLYHQSSHLGDEYLLRTQAQRINLSFEAAELVASARRGPWRVYGGGEYMIRHEPEDLRPGLWHGGLELRPPGRILRVGAVGEGRLVFGFDAKLWEQHDWALGASAKAGLEFTPGGKPHAGGRRLSLLLEGYHGPSPYGQFFSEEVSYFGLSLGVGI